MARHRKPRRSEHESRVQKARTAHNKLKKINLALIKSPNNQELMKAKTYWEKAL